ncbi:MAG: DUF6128 domain-containing protein [Lachnobacterium sp.]|nr:DUF6128 domain-containing protein [Lachnobacterium sp.]MDY2911585.1 DUF6128 domain-containing protein [Agathobacter sp.]
MERFITYMYAYENRIKGRNVGFVKVECRKDTCALEIHIRNLGRFSGKCRTYLLMDENVIGVELGTMIISYGQGQAIYYFDRNDIEQSGYRLEQVKAVRVECGSQKFLASCWSEEAGNWIAQDISAFMKSENMQADNVVSNGEEQIQKNNAQMGMPHNSVYNPARANQQESNAQFNPGYYNSESGNLSQLENTASQFPQSQIDRIDLADIRRLFPTKQYYANNSFVIHGFMNYSHLIVKTEDNKKYLGVPGIYEKPEEMMAKLFGFTEFVDEKTHSESQTEGAFGYWLSQAL